MSLDAVGVVSRDIARSVRFYAFLGVELVETGGPDHFEGLTESGVRIMLDSIELVKQLNPAWKEPQGSGITLCFLQDSPRAVDRIYDSIVESGFASIQAPWDAFWGQRYASVSDPDGNQIDLFAPL
jgi:uncharacterized glyoxalase superfamily protein PhnB